MQLAQRIGAVVLATAGGKEKRAYLRSLGIAQVMDSRTLDFADETLRYTGGRGCGCRAQFAGRRLSAKSLAVCAPHGRCGDRKTRSLCNNALPLAASALAFIFAFDLGCCARLHRCRATRSTALSGAWIRREETRTCLRTSFAAGDAVSAFRLMQGAQHIGKIVLEFDGERMPEVPAEFWPRAEATYLITGGLSGFGLATAHWLVERGATHLALLSRRGIPTADDARSIETMRERGVSVTTIAADVANPKELAAALRRVKRSGPPLRGVSFMPPCCSGPHGL